MRGTANPSACTGNRAIDRDGADLFLTANNAQGLTGALEQIAQSVCCGCIL